MDKMKKEVSPLLRLLNSRWETEVKFLPDVYSPSVEQARYPSKLSFDLAVEEAATVYAEWENSDPFAGPRMLMHLHRGLDAADKVFAEALKRVQNRRRQKVAEVEAMKGQSNV